jgi:uncharacterized protein YecE (DUF72 family)
MTGTGRPPSAPPGPRPAAEYRVGCASWLDRALIESRRFYPRPHMSAEARLRFYATFFDCVEVNATYYALPSPRNARLWATRTPPGFLFHVKAYSLMTGHEPRPESLPADVALLLSGGGRRLTPGPARGEIGHDLFPAAALDRCFDLFRQGLAPLAEAGKLGYVLFQLAPWVRYGAHALEYLGSLPARLPGWAVAVEFRNETWVPRRTGEVLRFLTERDLAFVCVDAPWQPFVPAATAPGWAVLRLHGRNVQGWLDQLAGRRPSVAEKYDYLYGPGELDEIAHRTRALATHARRVAVTFNNNNQDYPVQNALDVKRLLGLQAPPYPPGGTGDLLAAEDRPVGHAALGGPRPACYGEPP